MLWILGFLPPGPLTFPGCEVRLNVQVDAKFVLEELLRWLLALVKANALAEKKKLKDNIAKLELDLQDQNALLDASE